MDLRDKILAITVAPVHVKNPVLKGVYILPLNTAQMDDLEQRLVTGELSGHRVKLLIACMCDADGNVLFTESDTDAIGKLDPHLTTPCMDMIQELAGWEETEADIKKK